MKRIALPEGIETAIAQSRARWRRLARRERRLVSVALTVVALALLWAIAVQPAWHTLRTAPAQIDAVDLQLQQMQRMAGETRELRALPPVKPSQAIEALRGATDRLGPSAKLSLVGDRATVSFEGVPGEALAAWLGEVRSAARARPDDAKLSRGPAGSFSGSVTLGLARPG